MGVGNDLDWAERGWSGIDELGTEYRYSRFCLGGP